MVQEMIQGLMAETGEVTFYTSAFALLLYNSDVVPTSISHLTPTCRASARRAVELVLIISSSS
jgi:hypothetical protein